MKKCPDCLNKIQKLSPLLAAVKGLVEAHKVIKAENKKHGTHLLDNGLEVVTNFYEAISKIITEYNKLTD